MQLVTFSRQKNSINPIRFLSVNCLDHTPICGCDSAAVAAAAAAAAAAGGQTAGISEKSKNLKKIGNN